ncbi:hypothetical protein HRbin28_01873 [bacterium HR28]|nr:hypothetical protein HRbin28_01873 [bacterium HR28]
MAVRVRNSGVGCPLHRKRISRSRQLASPASSAATPTAFPPLASCSFGSVRPTQASVRYRLCFGRDHGPRQLSYGSREGRALASCRGTHLTLTKYPSVDRTWYALPAAPVQVTEEHRISVRRTALLATHGGDTQSCASDIRSHARRPSAPCHTHPHMLSAHCTSCLSGSRVIEDSVPVVPVSNTLRRKKPLDAPYGQPVVGASPAGIAWTSPELCTSELSTHPPLTLGGAPLVLAPAALCVHRQKPAQDVP